MTAPRFFGWRVVWAAFAIAFFGWGMGFYGPPVFLHAVQASRGWSVALVSAAVTCHFLAGALVVGNLPAIHARLGLAGATRWGAVASAAGMLGWALAESPWQLFAATLVSGAGWGLTSAAAIAAIVSPWFARRRSAALSTALNGASVGGIVMSPLWVLLLGALGYPLAVAVAGAVATAALWWLSGRLLSVTPEALGLGPDGDAGPPPPPPAKPASGGRLWRDGRFLTLAFGSSFGLFAQVGLVAHLFSLLVPALGEAGAGAAGTAMTVAAVVGRTATGWLVPPGFDRRVLIAGNYLIQATGPLALWLSGGTDLVLIWTGVVLFGLCLGNAILLPALVAQAEFPPADVARAVALSTALGQAAYAFGPLGFGALRAAFPPPAGAEGAAAEVHLAAVLLELMSAAVLLAGRR